MNLLPQASGIRPRVACEISPDGVVVARSAAAGSPLSAVARVDLGAGAVVPGLKPGNVADRVAVIAAVRTTMEKIGLRPNARGADVSLVLPDAAVRVLLVDFDALPAKITEALPLVRFRLKKLLPFDADEAMVSYQVMTSGRGLVRVLAVAIPRDVLAEYEGVVREAGYDPGAVLPSTLAALAGIEGTEPSLLVNANEMGVTTAIVNGGVLLLHRSIDLQEKTAVTAEPVGMAEVPAALLAVPVPALPVVGVEETQAEWAAQEPLPEHGRNPYAGAVAEPIHAGETGVVAGTLADFTVTMQAEERKNVSMQNEIAQAVSVAAAYFEDTLAMSPGQVLSAGPMGADRLARILREEGVGPETGLTVRELVGSGALLPDAISASVPRGWLSGAAGALRA